MYRSKQLFIILTLGLGLTLALLTLLALPARAVGFTVTKFTDSADGTCDADCSLREAIIAANASGTDDTITMGAGTYTLSIEGFYGENAGDLDITAGQALTITGLGSDQTIIDAGGIDGVFDILTGTVVISGVTISNGEGGINNQGDLTLLNSAVISNASYGIYNQGRLTLQHSQVLSTTGAHYLSGGIVNYGAVLLEDCEISHNTGRGINFRPPSEPTLSIINRCYISHNEGGILATNSNLLAITRTTIYSNVLDSYSDYSGAGLAVIRGAIVTVTQSSIMANEIRTGSSSYTHGGAGVAAEGGKLTLQDTEVMYNKVTDDESDGAGVWNWSAVVEIKQSNISYNQNQSRYGSGGGIYNDGPVWSIGALIIEQSTIAHNVDDYAGGIYNRQPFTMTNSTVSHNISTDGIMGGFYHWGWRADQDNNVVYHPAVISNSTISHNTGHGIWYQEGASLSVLNSTVAYNSGYGVAERWIPDFENSILAYNTLGNCRYGAFSNATNGYNLSSDDSCDHPNPIFNNATDIHNTDPNLGPLQNNGGWTETHDLPGNSPAVDAAFAATCPSNDQRGADRPFSTGCDIGAVEYSTAVPSLKLNTATLFFTASDEDNNNPSDQILDISNGGSGVLDWTAQSSTNWITLSKTSGSTPDAVTISIDRSQLPTSQAGSYSGQITISSDGLAPVTINVTLLVGGKAVFLPLIVK